MFNVEYLLWCCKSSGGAYLITGEATVALTIMKETSTSIIGQQGHTQIQANSSNYFGHGYSLYRVWADQTLFWLGHINVGP